MVLKTSLPPNRRCRFTVDPDAFEGHHGISGKFDLLVPLFVMSSGYSTVEFPRLQLLGLSSFNSYHRCLSTVVLKATHYVSTGPDIYHFVASESHFLFPPWAPRLEFKKKKKKSHFFLEISALLSHPLSKTTSKQGSQEVLFPALQRRLLSVTQEIHPSKKVFLSALQGLHTYSSCRW